MPPPLAGDNLGLHFTDEAQRTMQVLVLGGIFPHVSGALCDARALLDLAIGRQGAVSSKVNKGVIGAILHEVGGF